jgi:putative Mg2+ transporter-C (MgtC) family protein
LPFLVSSAAPALGGWDALLRLVVAGALGAVVGFERELRDREAGVRTHLLVSLGSALFTIVSAYGFHEFLTGGGNLVRADPTRIAAQIVTGIGFLGAGAIIREGLSVRGLTTAATLWVVAAIGMTAGAGWYWPAVAATVLTIFALWPLRILAYRVIERIKPEERRLIVELKEGQPVGALLDTLPSVRHFELADEPDRRVVQLELPKVDEQLVARLSDLDYVIGVRWRR